MYYLFQNDETRGPFTIGQLRSMWHAGSITGETHYCEVGSEQWLKLKLMVNQLEPKPAVMAEPDEQMLRTEVERNTMERDAREAKEQRENKLRELRSNLDMWGTNWVSCPRCESPATGTRGCIGVLFFPISLLLMKPTYTCGVCGFRFKQ